MVKLNGSLVMNGQTLTLDVAVENVSDRNEVDGTLKCLVNEITSCLNESKVSNCVENDRSDLNNVILNNDTSIVVPKDCLDNVESVNPVEFDIEEPIIQSSDNLNKNNDLKIVEEAIPAKGSDNKVDVIRQPCNVHKDDQKINTVINKEVLDYKSKESKSMDIVSGDFEIPVAYETELCQDGIGGTYFLKSKRGKRFAVFKPEDEEPGSINNPKQQTKQVKFGVKPGEGAIRECLAYLLDKDHFAKVPKTKHIELNNFLKSSSVKKRGSIQQYIENIGNSSDFSSSKFSVGNVQRIAQLDIRTFNMDRNGENLLVIENEDDEFELIPIDHTYVLPNRLDGAWFEWMHWKQAKESILPEVKKYIEEINIEKDSQILKNLGIDDESIGTMRISTHVLKRGCKVGWNLFQIANFICRPINGDDRRSELEKLVQIAKERSGRSQDMYWEIVHNLVNEKIF